MKANSILDTIGNTPHVKINRLFKDSNVEVWAKLERNNLEVALKTVLL
jgi:cysteine synthase A